MKMTDKTSLVLTDKKGDKILIEKNNLTMGDVLKAMEFQEEMESEDIPMSAQMEKLINFNVKLFDDKRVTRDSILLGISNVDALKALNQPLADVLGIDTELEAGEKK